MARSSQWEDEFTLLCERCGYVLEGLDRALPCPECGKPIEESLPERRVGTPWQNEQMFGSFLLTAWRTLARPITTLDAIKPGPTGDRELFRIHATLASFPIALAIGMSTATIMRALDLNGPGHMTFLIIGFTIGLPVVYACVAMLTNIERRGLELLGRRRGARITRAISGSITAHGSVGWLLGSWLVGIIAVLGARAWDRPDLRLPLMITPISAMLPGFLFFEVFAYLGLRRLQYANRVRPVTESGGPHPTIDHA